MRFSVTEDFSLPSSTASSSRYVLINVWVNSGVGIKSGSAGTPEQLKIICNSCNSFLFFNIDCWQYHIVQHPTILFYTLFPKRNATLISGFLWWPWTKVIDLGSCIRCIVNMKFGPNFSELPSSPKERQLQKSCVSFGEECSLSICILSHGYL